MQPQLVRVDESVPLLVRGRAFLSCLDEIRAGANDLDMRGICEDLAWLGAQAQRGAQVIGGDEGLELAALARETALELEAWSAGAAASARDAVLERAVEVASSRLAGLSRSSVAVRIAVEALGSEIADRMRRAISRERRVHLGSLYARVLALISASASTRSAA